MSEQELLRTALVLPPRARRVLCVWAAVPGLVCAPFAFWQSVWAGAVFCAVWAALVALVRARCCSFVAALTADSVTVQAGVAVPVLHRIPRRNRVLHHFVHGIAALVIRGHRHGQVALRVTVDRQHAEPLFLQPSRQNAGGRGLCDAALLVRQCEYCGHFLHLFQCNRFVLCAFSIARALRKVKTL